MKAAFIVFDRMTFLGFVPDVFGTRSLAGRSLYLSIT